MPVRFLAVALLWSAGCAAVPASMLASHEDRALLSDRTQGRVPARRRGKVDEAAMREAMSAVLEAGSYASSASYAHFLKARLAHHLGEHRRAIDELRLSLASDPSRPYLFTALAEQFARMSDLDQAERELRKVMEVRPTYYPAQLLMGRVLLESQKLTRARVHLKKAIQLRPSQSDAYLLLTQLHLDAGQVDQAVRTIETMGQALPEEPVGFKRLGMALLERNDHGRAERLLEQALRRDPSDFEVLVSLGQLYETTSRHKQAESAYAKALERDPESAEVLLSSGRLALKHGSVGSARAYFEQLLSVSAEPETVVKVAFAYLAHRQPELAAQVLDTSRSAETGEPRLSFYAGLVHERLRRFDAAEKAFAEVPESSELFHEAKLHRASCLSRLGKHGEALSILSRGLKDKPDSLPTYTAYARALERSGRAHEAERFLLEVLEQKPAVELFEALADTLHRQGRHGRAVEVLVGAVAKSPRDEGLLYILGAAYERLGNFDKSLEKMRAVLQINPDNAAALNFIGYTLAERGRDFDEAERLVSRALELKPDSGAFMDSLGWVYFRRGDYQRAVHALERADALAPGDPLITEHLGDAYRRTARKAQAVEAYRKALDALKADPEQQPSGAHLRELERKLKMLSTETADR